MTRVRGRPIRQILFTMTDEQVKDVVTDLKRYVAELRPHAVSHAIVFTHGDLNPRNILGESGKVTGNSRMGECGLLPGILGVHQDALHSSQSDLLVG